MKAKYLQRQWAETIRLYSGLLEHDERNSFIKLISNEDILLAAECRAISFDDEEELDQYLFEAAHKKALTFTSPQSSAEGLMALAELNKFEEITEIFSSIPEGKTRQIHFDIVAQYIASGSEIQIATFLTVLVKTNKQLFNRAIDKIFDSSIFFSTYSISQANSIFKELYKENEILLAAKVASTFSIKTSELISELLLYSLFDNMHIFYAERFIETNRLNVPKDLLKYLTIYIHNGIEKKLIINYLGICERYNIPMDFNEIKLALSLHLNPLVKQYALQYRNDIPITHDLAYKICTKNIQIANKSSIEFAFQVRDMFALEKEISIDHLINILLKDPKHQKLEYAYKLINEYKLEHKYPLSLIFNLLIATLNTQSLYLAKLLILNRFSQHNQIESLFHLCCLMYFENGQVRIVKEILLKDIQSLEKSDEISVGRKYWGFVSGSYKKNYIILFSSRNLAIHVRKFEFKNLSINSFVEFKIQAIKEKITDAKIEILNYDLMASLRKKFYLGSYFIGQIIELRILSIEPKKVLLKSSNSKKYTFVLLINEISHNFINDIHDYLSIDQNLNLKIIGFQKYNGIIYCSLKQIIPYSEFSETKLAKRLFEEKLDLLKQRFKKN